MEAGCQAKRCSKLLELAATDDLPGFVHQVEKNGSDIDGVSFWYGRRFGSKKMGFENRTPLMIAALYGSTEVLKYILESGKVNVNRACGADGATALHCAAGGGSWSSLEIVHLLINAAADINITNADGKKPAYFIPPCIKSSAGSTRKTLELLLTGGNGDLKPECAAASPPKKEYPMDIPLPDINNGIYSTDEFRMYSFKVNPCSRAYSHDWTECPFVHPGENARRRDPRKYHYTCVPCPEFKKGGTCAKGDACEYAHGVFESWLHPAQYRTRLCKDETGCARKVCFFAHKPDELRPLYASTGSAIPSPKSIDLTKPVSPSVTVPVPVSSPMWSTNKADVTPPALQLPGSRLKAALSARDLELSMKLEKIRTEMASISSSSLYERVGNLKPTNLDDVLQMQSPSVRQLRASYPSARNSSPLGFDSAAAVAMAMMNARSSACMNRSQSFVDRTRSTYCPSSSGLSNSPSMMGSKLGDWGSPDGKLDWGFNDEDANKLRKSMSFGIRSGNAVATAAPSGLAGGRVGQWHSNGVHDRMPSWIDQMYIEQEQMVA